MGRIKTELHTNDVFYAQLRRACFLGVRGGWCVGWTGRAGEGEHVLLLYPMRNEWGGVVGSRCFLLCLYDDGIHANVISCPFLFFSEGGVLWVSIWG